MGWSLAGALAAGVLAATGAPATAEARFTVQGTITGDGRPTYGRVDVLRENDTGTSFENYTTTYVNGSSGRFSVTLPNGVYKFRADDDRYPSRYVTEWYDDAATEEAAEEVVVDGARVTLRPIDLALRPLITGRVTNAAGKPMSDVRVAAYRPETPWNWTDYVTTEEDGRYYLQPGPGTWLIEFTDGEGELAREWHADAASASGATPVAFDGSAVVDLGSTSLTRGASIAGRVTDAAGTPVRGIAAALFDDEGNYVTDVFTDRTGGYVLPRLAAGTYRLAFEDGRDEFESTYWKGAESLATATPIVLARDQAVTGYNAVLTPRTSSDPDGVEVTGVVVDAAGKPVRGLWVGAVPVGEEHPGTVDYAMTDRHGRYHFSGLDPESLADEGGDPSWSAFRLVFHDDGDEDLEYLPTWLGGARNPARSATVTVRPGTVVTAPRTTIQQYAGLRGTVTSARGDLAYGYVEVYDADGRDVDDTRVRRDGTFELRYLLPDQVYRLRFEGEGSAANGMLIPTWWRSGNSFATATPVSTRGGAWVSGITMTMTDQVTAFTRPAITGSPVVGRTLTASTGTWNLSAGSEWTYEWLRGSTVVGTGRTYRIAAADAGHRLAVRVTNWPFQWYGFSSLQAADWAAGITGTATSAPSAVVRQTSRTTVRASFEKKKRSVRLVVRVAVPGVARPAGTVTVREGKRAVASRVKLVKGVATIRVKKPTKGKRTYAVSYSGTAAVLPSSTRVSVRVR